MNMELIERLRSGGEAQGYLHYLKVVPADYAEEAADLIERQDILIKEMAATLRNMALSLSDEDTEE